MLTGDQVLAARTRAGLTQQQLADQIGVTLRSVGNWERSERVPRAAETRVRAALSAYLEESSPSGGLDLAEISDARLLAEIARRFDRGREERGDGDNAAPTNPAGGSPADNVTAGPWVEPDEELPMAAHPKKGRESQGRQLRRHLDEIGEESQDPGE